MNTKFSKPALVSILIVIITQSTTCYYSHYGIEIYNKTGVQISLDSIVSNDRSFKLEIDTLVSNKDAVYMALIETDSLYNNNNNITHFVLYYTHSSPCNLCNFEKIFKPKYTISGIHKIILKK